jgi:hypothetical protein
VSGDLESATTVASFMEGFWGMGATVSSYSTAKRLEVGSPGGGQGGRNKKGQDPEAELRRALADRIEDTLGTLLQRVETLLREDRIKVLSLAHALETHKTLSGEDIVAVMEHRVGPLLDGRPYADPEFLGQLEEYHQAAAAAHHSHGRVTLAMPPAPALAPVVQGAVASLDGGSGLDGGPALDGGAGPGQNGGPGLDGGTGPNGSPGLGGEWAPGSDWAPGSGPTASP